MRSSEIAQSQIGPPSPFAALVQLRQAAEVLNANAQNIIRTHERKPKYTTSSRSEADRKQQKRASARHRIVNDLVSVELIRKNIAKYNHVEATTRALGYVQRAVALKVLPVFVGVNSYPTAHEASLALGELVVDLWQTVGGDYAVEVAPNRMHAGVENDDADVALEVNVELWRELRRMRGKLPVDLWGQIQQEYHAASELLIEESNGQDPGRPSDGADPCGKWLYELWTKGVRGDDIVAALAERRTSKQFADWPDLSSYNGVKGRMKKYAAANGPLPIDPRPPGRPKKKK